MTWKEEGTGEGGGSTELLRVIIVLPGAESMPVCSGTPLLWLPRCTMGATDKLTDVSGVGPALSLLSLTHMESARLTLRLCEGGVRGGSALGGSCDAERIMCG